MIRLGCGRLISKVWVFGWPSGLGTHWNHAQMSVSLCTSAIFWDRYQTELLQIPNALHVQKSQRTYTYKPNAYVSTKLWRQTPGSGNQLPDPDVWPRAHWASSNSGLNFHFLSPKDWCSAKFRIRWCPVKENTGWDSESCYQVARGLLEPPWGLVCLHQIWIPGQR